MKYCNSVIRLSHPTFPETQKLRHELWGTLYPTISDNRKWRHDLLYCFWHPTFYKSRIADVKCWKSLIQHLEGLRNVAMNCSLFLLCILQVWLKWSVLLRSRILRNQRCGDKHYCKFIFCCTIRKCEEPIEGLRFCFLIIFLEILKKKLSVLERIKISFIIRLRHIVYLHKNHTRASIISQTL